MNTRWTEGVRREQLPNGLILLAQPARGATAVASVCHIRAGFFDEPDAWTGVSHVLEHMLFKGTPTRGVGAIAREMKSAGGYLNAGTGYDHTAYYAILPPESLGIALDLQADALRRSLIDRDELKRELVVIIEEAKRKLDTPGAVAGEALHALLFDQHRIRRWRIGTEAQLAALSHADVVAFYRSRYVPSRTIVAMAGLLAADAALATARDLFSGWEPAAPTLDPSPAEPEHREVRARTLRGDVQHADVVLGWRSVPPLHPDAAALDYAALILGSGRASWLYRALRASGLATAITAGHFAPTEVGVFSIAAELDPARLDAALSAVAASVARLREQGPDESDLARARTLITASWGRRLQTAEGRAAALAAAEALGGFELLDEEYRRLLAVTGAEVKRVAAEYLSDAAVAGVAYLPEAAPQELTVAGLRRAFGPALPQLAAATPVIPTRVFPPAVPIASTRSGGVLQVRLPAHDLLLQPKDGVPLVSLGLYRRRTVPDSLATAGLAALTVRAAVRGAGSLDAATLALAFEQLGGTLTPLLAADWFGFTTTLLAERVLDGAVLLDSVLRNPAFESAEIARERTTLAEEAVQAADDMLRYPIQLALRGAFGDGHYGLPAHGFPESVPTLSDGMVRAWHACELALGRTVVVAVGEFDPERLAGQLGGWFHGEAPRPDTAAALTPQVTRFDGRQSSVARNKRQTALALLFPGPRRGDSARYTALVWSAIASGLGGTLFTALREERSLAYTVLASTWQRSGAGGLLLYLATSPERESEAREAALLELLRFAQEAPAAEDLARAINYLSGQVAVQRQTTSAVAAEIAEAWLMGTGLEELRDPAAGYRAVTAEAVQHLAQASLARASRVEGIVRGA